MSGQSAAGKLSILAVLVALTAILAVACGGEAAPTASPTPTIAFVTAATPTPPPSPILGATAAPTDTPPLSASPEPTARPTTTSTPVPTPTPIPTVTPEPTPIPVPTELSLPPIEISAGTTLQLEAIITDQNGNPFADAEATWTVLDANPGSINAQGLFTAGETTGTYEDSVEAQLPGSDLGATAIVTITHGPLAQVLLTPETVELGVGDSL